MCLFLLAFRCDFSTHVAFQFGAKHSLEGGCLGKIRGPRNKRDMGVENQGFYMEQLNSNRQAVQIYS